MKRAAQKALTLTATTALLAAPIAVITATAAHAATAQELTACTKSALQSAITAGGTWDLAVCGGKTVTQVGGTALVDAGSTTTLSYTGAAGNSPKLNFTGSGSKAALLDVN